MHKKLNEWADASKALHALVIVGFMVAFMLSIFSCQDYYIGKTREELAQEMFEIDSLMKKVIWQADSLGIYDDLYIDAQRINNGSN
jgi:preprotein translocase subunit SecE|tara:strand:- start:143 stop:400 length:258 start_codon:yes stop_codon:yes gene_type:complete